MRIIVTGGAGFIGSSFVHFMNNDIFREQHIEVLVVDKLTYAGNEDNLPPQTDFLKKDICDLTEEDLGEYTHIVNFAAETHVDNSITDGSPFVKTNVNGTFHLLELARKNPKFRKFIQISTDEVYGDIYKLGNNYSEETDALYPSSYYSATKASADMLVQSAGHTFEVPYVIVRMCNNYGVRQHSEKFIPKLLDCIKDNIPVPVYGDGLQQREWIWVEDSVEIIWKLLNSELEGIFNVGTGHVYTNLKLVQFAQKSGLIKKTQVDFIADRKGHDRRYTLNCFKLKEKLNISNRRFAHIYKFLKDNMTNE